MSLKFEPIDFISIYGAVEREYVANKANDIFQEWLEKQPIFYLESSTKDNMEFSIQKLPMGNRIPQHKARLVCVEPIVKCEHNDIIIAHNLTSPPQFHSASCAECGKKLKPVKWEEI